MESAVAVPQPNMARAFFLNHELMRHELREARTCVLRACGEACWSLQGAADEAKTITLRLLVTGHLGTLPLSTISSA